MTSKELAEWQAYYKVEPFGEERADLRAAITSCVIANCNRGKKSRAFKVEEFMPKFEPKRQMSNDEIKSVLKGLCNGDSR